MAVAKRAKTANRGADDERDAILRKVRRLIQEAGHSEERSRIGKWSNTEGLLRLAAWIGGRVERTKKPGGLGKK